MLGGLGFPGPCWGDGLPLAVSTRPQLGYFSHSKSCFCVASHPACFQRAGHSSLSFLWARTPCSAWHAVGAINSRAHD